jgi:hypothetical protein
MGSPTIFSGRYTKLLTQKGLLQQGGAVNQYDGLRNYIKNSSFESNTDEGWNRVKTTITGNLPTGTPTIGKVIAVAPSISSFGPFSGSAPFDTFALRFGNIISTVVAGEGVITDAFTVDPGDRGKVLTFKLYYQSDAGASTDNWSGVLGSQTWAVYIYDQTAGAWLQPTGFLGMNQNSGVGVVSGTFQSSVVAGQQYRIAVIALRNTTATSALQIDDVYVGPQTAPIGPVVTDWQDFPSVAAGTLITSTGTTPSFGTTSVNRARWRRVGDSAEIEWNFAQTTAGTAGTGAYLFNLPAGLVLDSGYTFNTNVSSASTSISAPNVVGSFDANYEAGAAKSIGTGEVIPYSNTRLKVYVGFTAENSATDSEWWGNFYGFNLSPMSMTLRASVKIQGWSSSVQMSSDTDTRVVAASIYGVGATVPVGIVNFQTVAADTHGAYSSGVYRFPVSGLYRISVNGFKTSGVTSDCFLRINGVDVSLMTTASTGGTQGSGTLVTKQNAGDTVAIYNNTATWTPSSTNWPWLSIERLSGPSVIAASEVVEATYQSTAGNSMTNGTEMFLDFPTKIRDTHGAVSGTGTGNKTVSNAGWKFTAPITGRYYVNAVFHVTSGAVANSVTYGYIAVNGSAKSHSDIKAGQNPAGDAFGSQINGEVFMNAGDYLEVVGYQANGANRNQQAVGIRNQVEIVRVGAY